MRKAERIILEQTIQDSFKRLWGRCIDLMDVALPTDRQYTRVRKEILDLGNSALNDVNRKLDDLEQKEMYELEIKVKGKGDGK